MMLMLNLEATIMTKSLFLPKIQEGMPAQKGKNRMINKVNFYTFNENLVAITQQQFHIKCGEKKMRKS